MPATATLEERLETPVPAVDETAGMTEDELLNRRVQTYKPPKKHPGEIVYYYIDGDVNCPPRPAMVFQNKDRTLRLCGIAEDNWQFVYPSVYHRDDPILEQRPNLRKHNGVWDASTADKERAAEVADLKDKMLMLARALDRERGTNTASKVTEAERTERLKIQAYCIKHNLASNREIKNLSPEELKQKWELAGSPT